MTKLICQCYLSFLLLWGTFGLNAALVMVEDFQSLSPGSLDGQNGWTTRDRASANPSSAVTVAVDPVDTNNQVLQIAPSPISARAYRSFGSGISILDDSSGTLFFRFYTDERVNWSVGTSDLTASTPDTSFDSFENQIGFRGNNLNSDLRNDLFARNGLSFDTIASDLPSATWYSLWLAIDHTQDTYDVYIQGGLFTNQTELITAAAFREPGNPANDSGNGAITTFFTRTGNTSVGGTPAFGSAYVDDIWIDDSSISLVSPIPEPRNTALVIALILMVLLIFLKSRSRLRYHI